jgi:hypothetical protein
VKGELVVIDDISPDLLGSLRQTVKRLLFHHGIDLLNYLKVVFQTYDVLRF